MKEVGLGEMREDRGGERREGVGVRGGIWFGPDALSSIFGVMGVRG